MATDYPEPASTTTIVLLTAASAAAAVGAVFWWHLPLGLGALAAGFYVLHLLAIRRSASDAVIFHARRLREEARQLELEYETRLRDLDRLQPELERERKRIQEQWQHLKGLVEDRETRRRKVQGLEAELESMRKEAGQNLESVRRETQRKEERERELEGRIAELEAEQEMALQRESEMLQLTEQIRELESAGQAAELALKEISTSLPRPSLAARRELDASPAPRQPRLRAWQFIAHKQGGERR